MLRDDVHRLLLCRCDATIRVSTRTTTYDGLWKVRPCATDAALEAHRRSANPWRPTSTFGRRGLSSPPCSSPKPPPPRYIVFLFRQLPRILHRCCHQRRGPPRTGYSPCHGEKFASCCHANADAEWETITRQLNRGCNVDPSDPCRCDIDDGPCSGSANISRRINEMWR